MGTASGAAGNQRTCPQGCRLSRAQIFPPLPGKNLDSGTGKTLVALWVVEQMQAGRVLVLVPSLALLRQLLHEWLRETSLPSLAYLCVCSDKTVTDGVDSIATAQSDLDFPVSTNADNVRGFLDAPFAGRKIVLSTYQSADVVGKALREGEAFDLAICDEAYKTAGREGRSQVPPAEPGGYFILTISN